MKYKVNEGKSDRLVRVFITIGLLFFAIVFAQGTARIFCLILASMMAITTLMGWCPLYILFGFSTCAKEKSPKESAADIETDENGE